ncbi:MAG TPA: DUF58 domain-containing protein [Clostridia bacterium]|nr:DUF58 domain-containing protein [Clostridia bacterium]
MKKTPFDQDFLNKLNRLSLASKMAVKGSTGGQRKSNLKGDSVEFSDFKEYTPGDDFRRIDWNAYARFERLFIKLFMEEQQSQITIILDCSGSMDFGDPNKGFLAKQLAGIFCYLGLNTLDRVGLLCINDKVEDRLPYFTGKQGFWKALKFIEEIPFGGRTSLNTAIKMCQSIGSRGGTTIILSDLFSQDGYEEGIKYLQYQKQEISLIHILSPEELDPPWDGNIRLVDKEDQNYRDINVTQQVMRAYRDTLDGFLRDVREFCYNRGVHYVPINSGTGIEGIVFDNLVKMGVISS